MPKNIHRAAVGDRDLLTTTEAARELGLAYSTVWNHIKAGRIQTLQTPGGQHRIRRAEISRLLEGRPIEETPETYDTRRHTERVRHTGSAWDEETVHA